MPNPFIGYDDPHYHNHDLDDDVDEEWFQGRDGWDQTSLTKKKKKKRAKSPRNVTAPIPNSAISPPCQKDA